MLGISIIIPTFKRVEQTDKTLTILYKSSGWNRDYLPEIVIADSTPDDSIKKILTEFMDPVPLYIRPQLTGIAANKNVGANLAKNELIIFCDSDMEVESDTLINTLMYLQSHKNVAMVGGQVIWKGGELDGQHDRPRREDRMKKIDETTYVEAIYSRYMATYKTLFWQVGGYDEDVFNMRGEGSDLSIRFWRSGLPLGFNEQIKVHHVDDASSSATRHIQHPERGIIRDLIQLGFKYGLSDEESPNFAKTLAWVTEQFGEKDKYIIIDSIVSLLPYFWENREKIEKSRENIPREYDFKFLDVFTKNDMFVDCVEKAEERIRKAREKLFT